MLRLENLLVEGKKLQDWLVKIRRDFHRYPELSTEEVRTRGEIIKILGKMGVKCRTFPNHFGVEGLIMGGMGGEKTAALRAEMDALPLTDQKKAPYSSRWAGKMHACGHDAHMAILLGAAKILKDHEENLSGNVKLIFQPAEETIGGARLMVEQGVLENPWVDAIFGLHVNPGLPTGTIGLTYGQACGASDTIKINISGKSAHAASPHTGVDALVIAAYTITLLQTIISRNTDPGEAAVLSLGAITGGSQGNIVAQEIEIIGTVRTINSAVREQVLARIEILVEETARAMGGRGEVCREPGYPPLLNSPNLVDLVRQNAVELYGADGVQVLEQPSLGVEDFAFYLQRVPGVYFQLGCGNEKKGLKREGHNHWFDLDEDCLWMGSVLQVANVLRVLSDMDKVIIT